MTRIVFLHPDLGIGGAERAVIDAALALKSKGHSVEFVTAHHDPTHCFEETRDGTLKVTAVGDWLPRNIFGKFYALCAYIRMIFAAIYLVFFSDITFDLIFCDQISACTPVLRMSKAKILFYCHFPDMLLTKRQSLLKRLYRAPIDWLEEKTTGLAHCILVNSKFTAGVFKDTFLSLSHIEPEVLYPIPDFSALDKPAGEPDSEKFPAGAETVFLSINRYERKKNLALALQAMAEVKLLLGSLNGIHLVMAGGYDERVMENKEHYLELLHLAERLEIQKHVSFIRSFSDAEKRSLLTHSSCLVYTPDMEHFGIVPIEAMYMNCPVIAVASGGPLETVDDRKTGLLCKPDAKSFAEAMVSIVQDEDWRERMGKSGHNRVTSMFSFTAFTNQLNSIVSNCLT